MKSSTALRGMATVSFWSDDLPAARKWYSEFERLLSMGAKEYQPITPRESGFVTAAVTDPFGNILGIMFNPHYLEMLAAKAHK